jgi:hypothetical protein
MYIHMFMYEAYVEKEEETTHTDHLLLNLSWFKTTKRFPKV